jgi:hypothetical protein
MRDILSKFLLPPESVFSLTRPIIKHMALYDEQVCLSLGVNLFDFCFFFWREVNLLLFFGLNPYI